jgi:hypothetical protein
MIGTENDAFVNNEGGEVSRILNQLARKMSPYIEGLEDVFDEYSLRDINGNKVGSVSID